MAVVICDIFMKNHAMIKTAVGFSRGGLFSGISVASKTVKKDRTAIS